MKKISFLLPLIALAMVSCDNSPLAKADRLVRKEMPKNLVFPDSYDPIETKIDSAFYPMDDPEFYKSQERFYSLAEKFFEIGSEIERLESDIDWSTANMKIFSGGYGALSNYEYSKSKKKVKEYTAELNAKQEELEQVKAESKNIVYELKALFKKDPVFIGYRATHSFRSRNNAGQIIISRNCFLINKELTEIKASCTEEEYESLEVGFKIFKEKLESLPEREEE